MTEDDQRRMRELYEQVKTAQAELAALQRQTARGAIPDVALEGTDGEVRLSELFGDHDDLVLSFNMGTSCAWCTLWADEASGVYDHLTRRAAFVVTSPDDPSTQQAFAESRGWRFPMVSHGRTRFAIHEGFAEHDGERFTTLMPGFVTIRRTPDGLMRTGRAFYGPGDPYCSVFHFFDQLEDGPRDWSPTITARG